MWYGAQLLRKPEGRCAHAFGYPGLRHVRLQALTVYVYGVMTVPYGLLSADEVTWEQGINGDLKLLDVQD